MLPRYLFWTILIAICAYAFVRGRGDERCAAGVCLAASIATKFVIPPVAERYRTVDDGLVMIDLMVLAAFVALALRSKRFWPLWIAGLQLTNSMAHLMKAVDLDLVPRAYAAAAVFWSYPILLIIFIGTWRGSRRRSVVAGEPSPA